MTAGQPLVMIAGFDPSGRGSGQPRYVIAHALAATAAGYRPQIFCVSTRSEVVETAFGTLHRVASPRSRGYRSERIQRPFLARGVARYVRGLGQPHAHVIHGFGHWASSGVAAGRLLARQDVEAVPVASAFTTLAHENRAKIAALPDHLTRRERLRYRRDMLWVQAVADRAERFGYAHSRLVLVNYASVRTLLADACPDLPEVRIVPYAAPGAFAERPPAPPRAPGPPRIVSVARHDPRKGLEILIRALAGLAHAGVEFSAVLVGWGPLQEAHQRLVDALGLADRVELTGHVADPLDYLEQADVFVLPSLEEGSGSVAVLEALQAGVAIVASRCDGIPEDLSDGSDAVLVTPGAVDELRDALTELLGDERRRSGLAAAARATYEARFSAANFAATLGSIYGELQSA